MTVYSDQQNQQFTPHFLDWNQLLLDAAYWGNTTKITKCLNNGVYVNYTEAKTGRTALHYACRYDDGAVEYLDTCILLINRGADVTIKSAYGNTALSLIKDGRRKAHLQKEANRYSTHRRLLQNANRSVDVVKLFLCGAPAAGKTTLKKALTKKSAMPSFLRTPGSASGIDESPPGADNYSLTPGIDVNKKVIRGAGTYWIWDCAGQMEYFLTHGMFLGSAQSIFVVLFDLDKKLRGIETPLSTEYWLSFIKSVHVSSLTKPRILVVATHLDRVKDQLEGMRFANTILKELQTMFHEELDIMDEIFVLDGRLDNSKGMQALRVALKKQWDDIRDNTLIPKYCDKFKKLIGLWRKEDIPVLCWSDYRARVMEVYPIIEEDTIYAVTTYLQHMGELYLAEFHDRENQVILNIDWFTSEIIGSAFAGEEFLSRYKTILPNQPYYSLTELSQFFSSKMDTTRLLALLEHMDLLHVTKDEQYLLPGKLPTTMPDVYWNPSKAIVVKGRCIECVSKIDIINPRVFPCVQKKLLDMDLGSIMISRSAVKYVVGSVELMVQFAGDRRAINIAVLCHHGESADQECYDLLQDITSLVQIELHQKSPGTITKLCYLSQQSLRTHTDLDHVWHYTLEHMRNAENTDGFLVQNGNPENISDILFPGFDTIFLQENGIKCRFEWLPHAIKAKCFNRLDMEHEWREDYRTVGEALRIPPYEIKQIADGAAGKRESLTVNIIKAWCKREHRQMSIGMLRKLLKRLSLVDQRDALEVIEQVIARYNRTSQVSDHGDVACDFVTAISENLARWRTVLKRLWRQPIKTDLDPGMVVSQLDFLPADLRIIIQDINTTEQRLQNVERLLQFLLQREEEDWPAAFLKALRVTRQDPLANAIETAYQSI